MPVNRHVGVVRCFFYYWSFHWFSKIAKQGNWWCPLRGGPTERKRTRVWRIASICPLASEVLPPEGVQEDNSSPSLSSLVLEQEHRMVQSICSRYIPHVLWQWAKALFCGADLSGCKSTTFTQNPCWDMLQSSRASKTSLHPTSGTKTIGRNLPNGCWKSPLRCLLKLHFAVGHREFEVWRVFSTFRRKGLTCMTCI